MYWDNTPVHECAGWWTDDGTATAMIIIMSAEDADTSEEQLEEWKAYIAENKTLPDDYSSMTVDHLVGNIAINYSWILDEELYEKMDAAYKDLIKTIGAKEEF